LLFGRPCGVVENRVGAITRSLEQGRVGSWDVSGEGSEFEGLEGTEGSNVGDARGEQTVALRQHRARVIAAGVVGAVIAAFAVLNLNDVKVHWLFATGETPLIIVIVFAFLLGVIVDRLAVRARRKRGG
jgi:uncharacterized integral membrane protein